MPPNIKKFIFIIIAIILVAGLVFYLIPYFFPPSPIAPLKTQCPSIEIRKDIIVNGDSLRPILEPGQKITHLINYYDCFDIKRDDIIIYPYPGEPDDAIIKLIKGLPGDSFHLRREQITGRWSIIINDEVLINSQGTRYNLAHGEHEMLHLYAQSYAKSDGLIPKDTYLILGNLPQGSIDSTRFGLVHKDDILGKVAY